MAGFFQQNLRSATKRPARPESLNGQTLRDYDHARQIFVTDGFGNAPKFKYLFHVYFEIDTNAVSAAGSYAFPSAMIPGLLVKNINLPKFSVSLVELNQYNRKRYAQTKIAYDPVSVVFHDDNNGSMKKVWYNYFSYYYNDTNTAYNSNPGSLQLSNIYSPNIENYNWGYNGENAATAVQQPKPGFFKTIKIYGFNQHKFCLYTLINPIIERWEHDTYDYYQPTGMMENRMTVRYETVTYDDGLLNGQTPDDIVLGFGTQQYYDRRISPITVKDTNKNSMGRDGLVDPGSGVQGNTSDQANYQAKTARTNVTRTRKTPSSLFTAENQKILDGARGISNNTNARGIFNIPAPGATNGGSVDMYASSENVEYTQAPPIFDDSAIVDEELFNPGGPI